MRAFFLLLLLVLWALLLSVQGEDAAAASEAPEVPVEEPVLLEEADVKKLRVKAIRKLLAERGQECKGCTEKDEYVARFLEVQSLPKVEPPPRQKTAQEKMEESEKMKDILESLRRSSGMNFKSFSADDLSGLSQDELASKFGGGKSGKRGASGKSKTKSESNSGSKKTDSKSKKSESSAKSKKSSSSSSKANNKPTSEPAVGKRSSPTPKVAVEEEESDHIEL